MADDPKTVAKRFFDGVNEGDLEVIEELVADDFVEHEEFPGVEPNKAGVRQFFTIFRAAFPDLRMDPDQIIAEGDLVCVRSTMTGTHEGDFMGVPPTGKRVSVSGYDLVRVRDGQATEHWGLLDAMALMQQLGAIPAEAPA